MIAKFPVEAGVADVRHGKQPMVLRQRETYFLI